MRRGSGGHGHPDGTKVVPSKQGVRLNIPPACRYGDTITLEQYRRWEATR